jgi:hypothetical protein
VKIISVMYYDNHHLKMDVHSYHCMLGYVQNTLGNVYQNVSNSYLDV